MSERCSATKVSGGYRSDRCTRTASVEQDGKWWCCQHAPSAVAERIRKRDEKFDAERAARQRWWAENEIRAKREAACLNAFHSPDGRSIPTEAIEPGLVWKLLDALKQSIKDRIILHENLKCFQDAVNDELEEEDAAMVFQCAEQIKIDQALLSSLQPKRGV